MVVVMTTMTVTSMTTTPTMVKMTVVVEAVKAVGVEISRRHRAWVGAQKPRKSSTA